ncbi:MAG: hypothetical protein ABSH51_08060 [Solirubrobacteraceae bacterium]|jgi:hypothetical protein
MRETTSPADNATPADPSFDLKASESSGTDRRTGHDPRRKELARAFGMRDDVPAERRPGSRAIDIQRAGIDLAGRAGIM